jgi:hypothetical protein
MPLLALAEASDELPRTTSPASAHRAATTLTSTVVEMNDYRPRD